MSTPPTNAEADAAVPVAGTPSRPLTNAFLKDCISTLALKLNLSAVAAAVQTWLATPSSSNLFSALTSKTGSGGSVVFATGPSLSDINLSGITTETGASVTTPNTITITANAGVILTSAKLNIASNSANTSLTMSGNPATARTWFTVHLINSDVSNARTWTVPSAFSIARQAAITSIVVPANGNVILTYYYIGSGNYIVIGDLTPLANKGIQFGPFATGGNDTQEIITGFPFPCTAVGITAITDSGSADVQFRNITAAATATGTKSASSTKGSNQALTGTAAVAIDDTVGIIRSNNSTAVNLRGTIWVAPTGP